jgi:flagellar L-ring protein precursor FlgH
MTNILWLFIPISLFAQVSASPGSLYTSSGRMGDLARDLRAGLVDDIITIIVADNASAVATGASNTSRKSAASNNITALAGQVNPLGRLANALGVTNNQTLASQGQTTRGLTLSTTISARVVDVTANGTLVIEGTKDIKVNSEKQLITVHGFVRPADVTAANTVTSNQVANLQIHVDGKGVVGDAIKRPFILYRILLGLLPF